MSKNCDLEDKICTSNEAFLIPSNKSDDTATETQQRPLSKIRTSRRPVVPGRQNTLGYDKKFKINSSSILYARNFWEKMPQNNIWNKIKKGNGMLLIIEEIIETSSGVTSPTVDVNTLSSNSILINILQKLLKNWRKCSLRRFLEKECSSENEQNVKTWKDFNNDNCFIERSVLLDAISAAPVAPSDNISSINHIHESELPHSSAIDKDSPFSKALKWKQIQSFLLAVINFIIPIDLFGSLHNKKCFKKVVKKFATCGKYDVILLESLMFGVKINQCKWIKNFKTFSLISKVFAQIWLWLLKTFVIDILKHLFYVTETNRCKNQLFFFRKRNFQSLTYSACNQLLKFGSIKEINQRNFRELMDTYGNSNIRQKPPTLRFIPKLSGVRAILPIKNGNLTEDQVLKAKNLIIFVTDKFFPEVLTIRSDKDFERLWVKYLENLAGKEESPAFVVKVDISDAFGSIKHDILFSILSKLERELPLSVKFDKFIHKCRNNRSFLIPRDTSSHFPEEGNNRKENLIKVESLDIRVKETFENIKQLIKKQLFQIGIRQRFLITKGIAQGGSLSSALCDLYYSAMCHKYLRNYIGNGRIMMRSVDDFLYITPNRNEAENFMCFMEEGIQEFNCYINKNKTVHNLQNNECRIPYKGAMFCPASNQILVSVSSLLSCPPRYTIRLNRVSNPGEFAMRKLHQILTSRFSPLISHPLIVSTPALVANIWRTGLLTGARMPCLIKMLLQEGNFNSKFLVKNIQDLGNKMWGKIKLRWKKANRPLPLSRSFCVAVFIGAIYVILHNTKRQPPLKDLKTKLRRKTEKLLMQVPACENKFLPRISLTIFKYGFAQRKLVSI